MELLNEQSSPSLYKYSVVVDDSHSRFKHMQVLQLTVTVMTDKINASRVELHPLSLPLCRFIESSHSRRVDNYFYSEFRWASFWSGCRFYSEF